jgi:hypothetical protein
LIIVKHINFAIGTEVFKMKKNILLLNLVLCIHLISSGQTVYYYGVNNKHLTDEENAVSMIQVNQIGDDRIELETFMKWRNEWRSVYNERIKIKTENEYLVRKYANGHQIDKYVRFYSWEPGDTYKFVEMTNDAVRRRGTTSTKLPLSFEGEVTDYFGNELVKSKSIYKNNQLISNENWLENGEKYIDNIFYSSDIPPSYDIEKDNLLEHVSSKFSQHKLIDISGTILVGFVIMENGDLAGIHIVEGLQSDLNQTAVDALESFPGRWQPAVLNNENVRFYCTMPINFKKAEEFIHFNHLEYTDGMLFY